MRLNININDEPVILLDKLTLDDIKSKYSWILNAKTKNAILGEQGNTLVWYSGDWIDGEWYNGIWYSGNFYDGIWENGKWYSWQLDMFQLMDNKIIIQEKNDTASKFHNGIWKTGTFNGGTFGKTTEINWTYTGDTDTIWETGNFNNGIFQNSLWETGTWSFGTFQNSWWETGTFFNGSFNKGIWENGDFNGGDFIEGVWRNGRFNQINTNIASRFGINSDLTSITTKCIWEDGTFIRGEFYSGDFKDDNGNNIQSTNNQISIWKNGLWKNGFWFGGQFQQGTWENGTWYGGIWGTWASDWSDPTSYEQKRVDVFSGTTDNHTQVNFEKLSSYTDFNRVYVGSTIGSKELEVSGTTYLSGENQVNSYNNIPPFYYYTNYENLNSGDTIYLNDSEFEIYNSGTSSESPWILDGFIDTTDTYIISGGSFWYEQNIISTGTTNLIKEKNILLPAFNIMSIDIGLNSWTKGDSSDIIFLTLSKRQSGGTIINEDIDLIQFGLSNIVIIDLNDDIVSVELKLRTNGGGLNTFEIDYLKIGKIEKNIDLEWASDTFASSSFSTNYFYGNCGPYTSSGIAKSDVFKIYKGLKYTFKQFIQFYDDLSNPINENINGLTIDIFHSSSNTFLYSIGHYTHSQQYENTITPTNDNEVYIKLSFTKDGLNREFDVIFDTTIVSSVNDYSTINCNIPYFHSTSDYPISGVIDMEGNSNNFSNQEGDIHKLYITVNVLDNVDLNVRLLDVCGNTSYVIEEGSTIVKDYFHIGSTGFYELVFYENTNLDEVFLNFTSTKNLFNDPYEIYFKCHLITFRTSKLISNSSGERLYSGDEILIKTILKFDTIEGEKNNYKFYLTDINNNVISNSYVVQEESNFNQPDYITSFILTGTQKVDNYRLNINIYRKSNYYWFDSNIQVQTLRILEDNIWKNLENITDEDSDTYTYYKDRTGRNDVNILILSGFTFDIPENSIIKGFKFKVTRAGFYDDSESVLGSVKDRVFNVDYTEFRNFINTSLNFPNSNEFSIPTAYKIETIDYGQYEDYFGIESFNWTVERVNKMKLIYQPESYKSLRLSDNLYIEGRIYRVQARVFYQTSPTWKNGVWNNGVWINGTFLDGKFLNGTFLDGDISGIINSKF